VETWDKKLAFLSEVIDEWLTCQRNWMYLEPIFSAADIIRQLPVEAKLFAEVDKFWKDFMRKVNQNPNVMQSVKNANVLASFVKANQSLDKIQKNLEEYLETKRAAFPRFYFLSNDELLAILSQV
jgi:dynein heavy chain